jgi:hypothetical protein
MAGWADPKTTILLGNLNVFDSMSSQKTGGNEEYF